MKPLLLIMILAAALVFLARYFLEGDVVGASLSLGGAVGARASADGQFDPARLFNAFDVVTGWMNRNYAAATLLVLPFEAAAFKLAFRRVGNLNYPEWLVITAFLTAQTFVVMAFATPVEHWFPQVRSWALSLAVVYSVFSLTQFFRPYARWKAVLRSLLGFGLFTLLNFAFGLVLAAVLLALPAQH